MKLLPKNTVKAVAFILVFVFMFTKVSYAMRPQNVEYNFTKTFSMLPKRSVDMVYIGGSSVYAFWMPMEAYRQYGFTSYNYSHSSMVASVQKYIILEILRRQSPNLLIVDVRPFEYSGQPHPSTGQPIMYLESRLRRATDSIRYSANRYQMIENCVSDDKQRLTYHFDIAKNHESTHELKKRDNWKYAFGIPDEAKSAGGFHVHDPYLHEAISVPHNSGIIEEDPFVGDDKIVMEVWLDLVAFCAGIDTDVLFIIPPSEETEENHKKHNYMRRVAEENGIPFLDCNDIFDGIGLDTETDFYDFDHVNAFGAQKYTEWFGLYLTERYNLPERREDSRYADWDKAYELWKETLLNAQAGSLAPMPEDIRKKVLWRIPSEERMKILEVMA